MKLVKPSFEILTELNRADILKKIEMAGRTCYKSNSPYTEETGSTFLKSLVKRGHLSVIEHVSFSVKFICDRGVTHELVWHRLCAFSQESTRYCNYSDEVTFIIPPWIKDPDLKMCRSINLGVIIKANKETYYWYASMISAETAYTQLINGGWTPQQARSVLPNSLKTEIVATANLREWRHIFDMRCAVSAHPQIREIMQPLQAELHKILPELF